MQAVDEPGVGDVIEESAFGERVDDVDEPLQGTRVQRGVHVSMPAHPVTARVQLKADGNLGVEIHLASE